MPATFTKADFLQYLACPEELWFRKNRPELMPSLTETDLYRIEQGDIVDQLAKALFREPDFLQRMGLDAGRVFFQKKVEFPPLITIADIVVHFPNRDEYWLFEVKAATKVKPELIDDITFQYIVFQNAGLKITRSFLVHVNNSTYAREEAIDLKELLVVAETTEAVTERANKARKEIRAGIKFVDGPEPAPRINVECPGKGNCPFFKHHFPDFPAYSVFDISRISKNKLKKLVSAGIVDIRDVPEDFPLSKKQSLQVEIAKTGEVVIQKKAIKRILSQMHYPIYFID